MIYQTVDELMQVLGRNLKSARLAADITQQVAANRSGISLKAVRNLESGKNASTFSFLSYCRTLRKTDWLMQLAPPEVSDWLFERENPQTKRQRASAERRCHG